MIKSGFSTDGALRSFGILEVATVGAVESGNRGMFEWQSIFHDHAGRPVRLKGVTMIRVADDLFQEVHVYFDPSKLAVSEEE